MEKFKSVTNNTTVRINKFKEETTTWMQKGKKDTWEGCTHEPKSLCENISMQVLQV